VLIALFDGLARSTLHAPLSAFFLFCSTFYTLDIENAMQAIVTANALETRLKDTLKSQAVWVIDESADHAGHVGANEHLSGTHFKVKISAQAFSTPNRVQRHRIVYDAVQDFMEMGLHALAIEILQDGKEGQ
jgi:BolA protein